MQGLPLDDPFVFIEIVFEIGVLFLGTRTVIIDLYAAGMVT